MKKWMITWGIGFLVLTVITILVFRNDFDRYNIVSFDFTDDGIEITNRSDETLTKLLYVLEYDDENTKIYSEEVNLYANQNTILKVPANHVMDISGYGYIKQDTFIFVDLYGKKTHETPLTNQTYHTIYVIPRLEGYYYYHLDMLDYRVNLEASEVSETPLRIEDVKAFLKEVYDNQEIVNLAIQESDFALFDAKFADAFNEADILYMFNNSVLEGYLKEEIRPIYAQRDKDELYLNEYQFEEQIPSEQQIEQAKATRLTADQVKEKFLLNPDTTYYLKGMYGDLSKQDIQEIQILDLGTFHNLIYQNGYDGICYCALHYTE